MQLWRVEPFWKRIWAPPPPAGTERHRSPEPKFGRRCKYPGRTNKPNRPRARTGPSRRPPAPRPCAADGACRTGPSRTAAPSCTCSPPSDTPVSGGSTLSAPAPPVR
ncbi:hypothetical protein PanWU01x14_220230 [Parasponia andersonii]|uniref:Uncharacterized protein n=1 Tax=Parasponia andersonii TaxID=3476 RepID=A0A2P5BPZ9_PARAD|nr:hypothetical protein PanWU01x14_220230 [Parasponia andersonii]